MSTTCHYFHHSGFIFRKVKHNIKLKNIPIPSAPFGAKTFYHLTESINENASSEVMECRVAERDNKEHSAKGFIIKLLSNSSVSLINDFCTHTNLELEELSAMRLVYKYKPQ